MFVTTGEQLLNAGFEGAYTSLQSEWTVIVNIPDTLHLFRKKMEDNKCFCNNIFCLEQTHYGHTHTHSRTYTTVTHIVTHTRKRTHTESQMHTLQANTHKEHRLYF